MVAKRRTEDRESVWDNVDTKGKVIMVIRCGDLTSISFIKKTKITSFNGVTGNK